MKKWYEVYYQYLDKVENKVCLGKMPFWKFAICWAYYKSHGCTEDIDFFSYVSPSNVKIISE